MNDLSISVVICTHDPRRQQDLVAAVASAYRQTHPPIEVIVVVNGDGALLEQVTGWLPDVVALAKSETPGLSAARNVGVAIASGDVVAFLDDDAIAAPDWLEQLAAGYAEDDVIGVGGWVEPHWIGRGQPSWFPEEFNWVVGCSYRGLPTEPAAVRNPIGANMSFRREVFDRVGGFRPELGRVGDGALGCEETELSIRAARLHPGMRIVHRPAARVSHAIPPNRARRRYFVARCYGEGRSKAAIARIAGRRDALAAEQTYVARTLPAAFWRSIADAVSSRNWAGIARAMAVVAGVAAASAGFAVGHAAVITPTRRSPRDVAAPARRRGAWLPSGVYRPLLLIAASVALWGVSLGGVKPLRMNDLGLVSVLPWTFFAALLLLTASFWLTLRQDRLREPLLLLHAVVLIVVIHGTPQIVYGTLRYEWAWKHLGIVDYIQRHGQVDPNIAFENVYHSWPGFFSLAALVSQLTGVRVLVLAEWAPVFFEFAFLLALLLVLGPLVRDRRRIWLAAWLFLCTNWVGQDYFSPQALNFFLYLVLIAVCLRYFYDGHVPSHAAAKRWLRFDGAADGFRRLLARGANTDSALPPAATKRAVPLALTGLLCGVIATSHQLTPLMATSALAVLVVFQQCSVRWLPLLMAGLTGTWAGLMARPFLDQNFHWIALSIGTFGGNILTPPTNLKVASTGLVEVAYVDRALTVAVGVLAVVGAIRLYRRGSVELVAMLLVLSPLLLLWLNAYGGEMVFRVYLFALPFAALLASAALLPSAAARLPWKATAAGAATTVLLLAGMCVAYYGKERMNYFSPDEVRASRYVYATAPHGSLLLSISFNYPWGFTHYEDYNYGALSGQTPEGKRTLLRNPIGTIETLMGQGQTRTRPAYLIVTRSQLAEVEMTEILPRGWVATVLQRISNSPRFRLVYSNRHASVYTVRAPLPRPLPTTHTAGRQMTRPAPQPAHAVRAPAAPARAVRAPAGAVPAPSTPAPAAPAPVAAAPVAATPAPSLSSIRKPILMAAFTSAAPATSAAAPTNGHDSGRGGAHSEPGTAPAPDVQPQGGYGDGSVDGNGNGDEHGDDNGDGND
jgi:GT2 family glycosyltransferase